MNISFNTGEDHTDDFIEREIFSDRFFKTYFTDSEYFPYSLCAYNGIEQIKGLYYQAVIEPQTINATIDPELFNPIPKKNYKIPKSK